MSIASIGYLWLSFNVLILNLIELTWVSFSVLKHQLVLDQLLERLERLRVVVKNLVYILLFTLYKRFSTVDFLCHFYIGVFQI